MELKEFLLAQLEREVVATRKLEASSEVDAAGIPGGARRNDAGVGSVHGRAGQAESR